MARVKAMFDADILIHIIKSDALDITFDMLDCIYMSEYVYLYEIRQSTSEGKQIEKLKNIGKLKIINYESLTKQQKSVYNETYKLLKREEIEEGNPINEGERITAALAKAFNIYYYMSDDNKAASHIKSLTSVDIVNFCDILFLYLRVFGIGNKHILKGYYNNFINLYEKDKIPRILRNKNEIITFEEMMGRIFDRFNKNANLNNLLINISKSKTIDESVAFEKE